MVASQHLEPNLHTGQSATANFHRGPDTDKPAKASPTAHHRSTPTPAMASKAVIPRFLLPLQGTLWRTVRLPVSQSVRVRYASSTPSKPIVLEKPAKFNPPSHGSRLKKNTIPRHYGPQLTKEEIAVQNTRDYPGMMAPAGTWSHWFWHSRLLHTFITMVRNTAHVGVEKMG